MSDKLSDNGYGRRWTYPDFHGLFPQLGAHEAAGRTVVMVAWGSSMKERGRSSPVLGVG